ncbi:MAG: glycosyltransferase [Anderseniella sp.]
MNSIEAGSVLLYVHPPFYRVGKDVYFDTQAQNGLRLWAKNFAKVRVMAPVVDVDITDVPSDASQVMAFLQEHSAIEAIMLPRRGTKGFIRDFRGGCRLISAKIETSEYLVFGFSGFVGDWGTVACLAAKFMKRPYAVFKDSVGHRVVRIFQKAEGRSLVRRNLNCAVMKYSDRLVVRNAALSLLHGQDTFAYYRRFSQNPYLVHDIHIAKSDRIAQEALIDRLETRERKHLKVAYAGRVEAIKGPEHWVPAIAETIELGTKVTANWYGIGSLLDEQMANVESMGLGKDIIFNGWVDHKDIISKLKSADVFVFTHMTEESPRCLIEALSAGLPLVGFEGAYVRDLIGESKAGILVSRGDMHALAKALKTLADDPEKLVMMSIAAREVAKPLNDEDVFAERGKIIKANL